MKKFFALALGILSFNSFANANYNVQITSFRPAGQNTYAAELCAFITGDIIPAQLNVRVASDPQTNRAGIYNTFVDQSGRFCLAIVTYTGFAQVSVWGYPSSLTETKMTNKIE